MNEPFLPKQIVDHIKETHLEQHSRPTCIIYLLVSTLLIGLVVSMPFLYVKVSVRSYGILRPAIEIINVKIPSSGKVCQVLVSVNQKVVKGQKILTLDSTIMHQKLLFLSNKIIEDNLMRADLNQLILAKYQSQELNTPFYKQGVLSYLQKHQDLTIRYHKSNADYKRNLKLHQEKVIADAEFEIFQFELEKAKNELMLLKQNQLTQWQSEIAKFEKEIAEHKTQLSQLIEEKSNLIIKAPVDGTIQNFESIQPGSQVFANQDIAEISPDTDMIVEAYVNPNDIGLLQPSMLVRFQVDAFNYNQWGVATGKIIEISNDIHIVEKKPVFKVRCVLDQGYLQLKNGYKGYLKKGMTMQARFMVTERSLWQLLFDKIDDWLNPNTFSR